MLTTIKSFLSSKTIIAFTFVACSGLVSFVSTRLSFIKFQEEGLISLGNTLNIIGVAMVISSLSVESGLVRKIIISNKNSYQTLYSAILILYPLGITLGLIYIYIIGLNTSSLIIYVVFLYFPFSVLRSYLIASGKQQLNSLLLLLIAASTLFSVIFATEPDQIFNLVLIFHIIVIVISLISSIFILKSYKKFTTNFGEMFIENNPTSHVKSSIELLRFSIHSIASGVQNNQAMLVSRIFLVSYVSVEFAAQMEMYQRPLIWMFVLGASMVTLFFFPFAVKKMQIKGNQNDQLVTREMFFNIGLYGLIFFGLISISFPFLFWLTFGYKTKISLFLASFWITIFSLRFLAALFSSWLLAKDNVRGAIIAEAILYLPSIIFFSIPQVFFGNLGLDPTELFLLIIGISSIAQICYFLFTHRLHSIFIKKY